MRFMLSVFGPAQLTELGNYPGKATMVRAIVATGVFNEKLHAAGHFVYGNGLASATTASVVDGRRATPMVTQGQYLEADEYLGGFWVIEAEHLDQALTLAAGGSKACQGRVEVHPFQ